MRRAGCANAVASVRRFKWAAPAVLATIGGCAFAVGVLVYAADRNPAQTMLFPTIAALHTGQFFGVLGPWLPSFVHPFAFSLLTAAALQRSVSPAYGACAAWWAVNIAFEVGQHPQISGGLTDSLQRAFGHTWLTRALSNYFVRGSFDVGDVLAVTAGALAAAGVLQLVHHLEARHAH